MPTSEAYNMEPKNYKSKYVNGKQVREHIIVAEKKLGRKLYSNEVVHHVDGNKHNNEPENLVVMTRAEHALVHGAVDRLSKHWGYNKGKKMSERQKEKIRKSKIGENHHFYGKHLSAEHRAKLGKAVICIETKTKYETMSEAARAMGLKSMSSIMRACKNKESKSLGYHWRYANDD